MNRLAGETACPTAKWFGCNVGQAVLPAFRGVAPILSHLLRHYLPAVADGDGGGITSVVCQMRLHFQHALRRGAGAAPAIVSSRSRPGINFPFAAACLNFFSSRSWLSSNHRTSSASVLQSSSLFFVAILDSSLRAIERIPLRAGRVTGNHSNPVVPPNSNHNQAPAAVSLSQQHEPKLAPPFPHPHQDRTIPENLFRFIRSDIVPGDVKDVGFVPIETRAFCHLSKRIPIV